MSRRRRSSRDPGLLDALLLLLAVGALLVFLAKWLGGGL